MNQPNSLKERRCQPCEGKEKPLSRESAEKFLREVSSWQLDQEAKGIFKNYKTKNFTAAVDFINKIKDVAEAEDHHPDLHLTGYRNLRVELSTHAIGGLSENDFIVAAKIDELDVELKS